MSPDTPKWKRHLTKALIVLLIFMVCISILQWFVIKFFFDFGTGMLMEAMISQAPEEVNRDRIKKTFERVKIRARQLPFSFISGKIKLRKLKALSEYAIHANEDGSWDAEEIKTLLRLVDASVGYKQNNE